MDARGTARVLPTPGAPGAHRTAAFALSGLIVVLAAASGVLAVVNIGSPGPDFRVLRGAFVPDLAVALLYGPFGAFIMARTGHVIGWALQLVALGFGSTAFAIQYAVLGVEHPGLPGYAVVSQLVLVGWAVGALTAFLVVPWLVGRRAPSGWSLVAVSVGLVLTLLAGASRLLIQIDDAPRNALAGTGRVADLATSYDAFMIPVYFLAGLGGAAYLSVRARRAPPSERLGLGWVVVSVLLVACCYLLFEIGLSIDGPLLGVGAAALLAAMVMLPAAIFVLVVRQPSWELDLAVSRAVVGALLTATVVAAYIVLVWAGGGLLSAGRESAGLLAVALLALGIMPVRRWLQRRVERLVFGSTADAGELLDRLGADVGSRDDASILEGLLEGLRRSLRLSTVVVESAERDLRVQVGSGDPALVTVPLRSRGREVGLLRLAAPAGQRLDLRTVRLVEQISGLVAVALELTTVNTDLESARLRLVDVRQEERRLLRRELHDGIGPSLAGAALALAAIDKTSTLTVDDSRLVEHLQEELSRRADDIRQMARVLLPPALDDGRLGDALDVLAQRFTQARFSVTVVAEEPDRLDIGRQVAIYHIAAEGVLNAYRHAEARHCRVELSRPDDRRVRLTVTDDGNGNGVAGSATPGIGLASMRERAVELGGSFSIDSAGGGTRVTVELP